MHSQMVATISNQRHWRERMDGTNHLIATANLYGKSPLANGHFTTSFARYHTARATIYEDEGLMSHP
jgi:hypothetical protein